MLMLIIGIALFLIGLGLLVWGASEYEEFIAFLGIVVLALGIVVAIFAPNGDEVDSGTHDKYTYEEACHSIGGEFVSIEGDITCLVEE